MPLPYLPGSPQSNIRSQVTPLAYPLLLAHEHQTLSISNSPRPLQVVPAHRHRQQLLFPW
ncbi:hypothetical protein E2C01_050654 [Portunus trituberculatus]|uniref:Uncharacterized protein n=1 Tax=Portunus trituberculatus TaxID=210409 RepID=A0A5B7GGQ9_PORTR|nr:hypothetical protein [Portunus trituberculatus]